MDYPHLSGEQYRDAGGFGLMAILYLTGRGLDGPMPLELMVGGVAALTAGAALRPAKSFWVAFLYCVGALEVSAETRARLRWALCRAPRRMVWDAPLPPTAARAACALPKGPLDVSFPSPIRFAPREPVPAALPAMAAQAHASRGQSQLPGSGRSRYRQPPSSLRTVSRSTVPVLRSRDAAGSRRGRQRAR